MEQYSLPISTLRQMAFCPRIPYFTQTLGLQIKYPIWTNQGIEFHKSMESLSRRRSLERFNLLATTKIYRANVSSTKLMMHGIADLILISSNRDYPVEFNSNTSLTKGTVAQLIADGFAAEETYGKNFSLGLILGSGHTKVKTVERNTYTEGIFIAYYKKLILLLESSTFPDSSASPEKC